jgi:PRTRC genetic system ThiF family protein
MEYMKVPRPPAAGVHKLWPQVLQNPVKVVVVGCGGTGSVMAGWLPFLHKTLLALGHPRGLRVTLMDGDVVSETNCVRQAFSIADVGRNKAGVIVERTNLYFGTRWEATERFVSEGDALHADFVIGCVDTRLARKVLAQACERGDVRYWLDCGNNDYDGQFVLGEPNGRRWSDRRGQPWTAVEQRAELGRNRLPTVAEIYPSTVDATIPEDAPACSAVEALTRQGAFVNQVIASHACVLLGRLFRFGEISHHGEVVNLATGRAFPLPVPATAAPPAVPPAAPRRPARVRAARAAGATP